MIFKQLSSALLILKHDKYQWITIVIYVALSNFPFKNKI